MRQRIVGAALAAGLVLAAGSALAGPRGGGGNNDSGAGLNPYPSPGNDRTAGVRAGAPRNYNGYPEGYFGAYYGTVDPGPYGRPPAYYRY